MSDRLERRDINGKDDGTGGQLDNNISNLCWGTKTENSQDRVRDARARKKRKISE